MGATANPQPVLSAEQATAYSLWSARYALDLIGTDGRRYDPRLAGRLSTAIAQLVPAAELAKPEHDQPLELPPTHMFAGAVRGSSHPHNQEEA